MAKKEIVPTTPEQQVETLPEIKIEDVPGEMVEPDTDDWNEKPAATAAATETPEEAPEVQTVPTDELDYKALVETMDREMAANPTNLLTNLAKTANLSDVQKAELVRQLLPQPEESFLPEGYEPQGLLEPELQKRGRMDWLFKGEEKVQELISTAKQEIAPYVDNANQEVTMLRAEVDALKQVLGMKIDVNREAIQQEVAKGSKFNDAVQKVMGKTIETEVKKAIQAAQERPNTPGQGGNDLMERVPGMPMVKYLQAVKNGAKL